MKFSVIVPVYNVEKYLCECLESIINQTYNALEIICVDDGSTDASGRILDEYARLDERIIVIHKTNCGYGHTMNVGLKRACGEYIGIVESDDYIPRDSFERFADIIEKSEERLDVVKFSYTRLGKNERLYRELFDDEMCGKVIAPTEYMPLFRVPCSIWSAVYNRKFLLDNEIAFLETPGASYQDMSFTFKVFITAQRMYLSNESAYCYRTYNANSSVNSGSKPFCVCDEMREIDSYVLEKGMYSPFVMEAKCIFMHQSYWWNYHRLYGVMRYVFYLRMVEDFRVMVDDSFFNNRCFDEKSWNRIQKILTDAEGYFQRSNPSFRKYYKEDGLDEYTLKESLYKDALKRYLDVADQFIIYGAGVYGKKVLNYCGKCEYGKKVIGFAVTDKTNQEEIVMGIPVFEIRELCNKCKNATVIVAVKAENQLLVLRDLKKLGFENVLRVDDVFMEIMREVETLGD